MENQENNNKYIVYAHWITVKEAAKLTNIDISTIYGSLNYGKATKGVHWKYYNSDNSSVEEHEV